jgi:hypothetical protein
MNPIKKKRKGMWIVLGLLVLLIVIRIILPYIILRVANDNLAKMKGYYGHIEDVDLAILRGAYQINRIFIDKRDSLKQIRTPFFSASQIDLSVEWKAIWKGEIVGEVVVLEPVIRFTRDKVEPKDVAKDSLYLKKMLDEVMPLRINRFEISSGKLQYLDEQSTPRVDIEMTNINLLARNLRNSYDSTSALPASISATALVYGGNLRFDARANPLTAKPTFDMSAALNNTNLVELNDFFRAYAKADVNRGTFGLYTEVAAKDGAFKGYVKPIVKDLDVLGHEDRNDPFLRKMWEGIVGTVGEIFENQRKDQLATKIPLEGRLDHPGSEPWVAIANVLKNAFIQALQPSIDNEINLGSVESSRKPEKKPLLQRIFSKGDKKKTN